MITLFDKLYKKSEQDLLDDLYNRLQKQEKTFVVTANPEVFMHSMHNEVLKKALLDPKTVVTPDGEGIVQAAKMLGFTPWGKIAGVDTVAKLLQHANEKQLSIYIYGSKQEVLDALQKKLQVQYPNLVLVGLKNGYTYQEKEVFEDMLQKQPDIVLVALGVPKQELSIYQYFPSFQKGIFVGVGGSLDVLSGVKKRAPKIWISCKLEWLYRLLKEPTRIKRFYNNHIKFILYIKKLAKEKK
ncbi:MAG: WecB/TagA/CpsF family glycosyltransferase [Erysipelotrichaceae bacterium]|nr:WecB/TagA/CpsF family glycosyltransferase [Erysipelotrichaceae bacterium]